MSAYGAYGYALHGKSYQFILGHYFTGTTIGTISGPRVVRVLLDISGGDVGFSQRHQRLRRALDPARSYEAHRSGNAVVLRSSGGKRLANCGRKLRAAGKGRIEIAGIGTYRGALETVPTESDAGSLNVVNALAVDQYVKGVIPNESPPSWPAEELKAQAVASRSFALTGGVGGNGFDLYADTRSQVYEGLESEYSSSNAAADRDPRPGRRVRRQDRRDPLLGLLGRPHREHPERLRRRRDPLPAGRPRPLRRLLPAAQMDAANSAARRSAPSSAPTSTAG